MKVRMNEGKTKVMVSGSEGDIPNSKNDPYGVCGGRDIVLELVVVFKM